MAVNWLVDKIASGIAFAPPKPSYFLVPATEKNSKEYKIAGHRSLDSNICAQHKAYLIPADDKSSKKIAIVFIEYKRQLSSNNHKVFEPKTILFSHGNGEDLGQLIEYIWYLSDRLKANILAYDYSGYGVTDGKPSVQQSLKDIQTVFKYMKEEMKFQAEDIILYGQSVGSGPSVYLAATESNVGGLILHSPLQSGLRVLYPNLQKWPMWCDVYPNYMLVHHIKCPTLIMHKSAGLNLQQYGCLQVIRFRPYYNSKWTKSLREQGTKDQIIDVSHAKSLEQIMRDSCSYLRTFWAVGYDHSDIQVHPDYFRELKHFVNKCHQIKIYNFEKDILKNELTTASSLGSQSQHNQQKNQKQHTPQNELNFKSPFQNVPSKKRYEVDVQKVRVTQDGKIKRHRFKVINIIYKQDQKIKLIQQNRKQSSSGSVSRTRSGQVKRLQNCAGGIRIVRAKRKKVKGKVMKPQGSSQKLATSVVDVIQPAESSSTQKQQRLKSLMKRLSVSQLKKRLVDQDFVVSDDESPQAKSDNEEKSSQRNEELNSFQRNGEQNLSQRNSRKSSKIAQFGSSSKSSQPFPMAKSGSTAIRQLLKGINQQKST